MPLSNLPQYAPEDLEKILEVSRNNKELVKARKEIELAHVRRVSKWLNVLALAIIVTGVLTLCLIFKLI